MNRDKFSIASEQPLKPHRGRGICHYIGSATRPCRWVTNRHRNPPNQPRQDDTSPGGSRGLANLRPPRAQPGLTRRKERNAQTNHASCGYGSGAAKLPTRSCSLALPPSLVLVLVVAVEPSRDVTHASFALLCLLACGFWGAKTATTRTHQAYDEIDEDSSCLPRSFVVAVVGVCVWFWLPMSDSLSDRFLSFFFLF